MAASRSSHNEVREFENFLGSVPLEGLSPTIVGLMICANKEAKVKFGITLNSSNLLHTSEERFNYCLKCLKETFSSHLTAEEPKHQELLSAFDEHMRALSKLRSKLVLEREKFPASEGRKAINQRNREERQEQKSRHPNIKSLVKPQRSHPDLIEPGGTKQNAR